MHNCCAEVFYKSINYDSKQYLGILITAENQEYVIPLSSAKEKHKKWKDVEVDRFVIYEFCSKTEVTSKDIFIEIQDDTVKHILSVIDIKKMIPVNSNLYTVVELNPNKNDSAEVIKYKALMNLEYNFCLKIMNQIIHKAAKLYEKQMKTKKVIPYCCDFELLEKKCKEWNEKFIN